MTCSRQRFRNWKGYMQDNVNSKAVIFKTPSSFNERTMRDFLSSVEPVFRMKGKDVENVTFDVSYTTSANILGMLMIYKFLDYTVKNKCFMKPLFNVGDFTKRLLDSSGFTKWVLSYVNDINKPADYGELRYQVSNDLFIAPIALNRQSEDIATSSVNNSICQYYGYNPSIRFAILTCIGEVISNFAAHADNETKTVLVASGNKNHFELACADNGIGIVSSLNDIINRELPRKENYEVLERSLDKGITSKLDASSGHMGCGLWILNQYITATKGEMHIFSEGAYIHNHQGRMRRGKCGYWKGTIIYLTLPLSAPNRIAETTNKLNQ